MSKPFIGDVRRALFKTKSCKWNAYVRDITAEMEKLGYLSSTKEKK